MLGQYSKFDSSSPSILCLDPLAVVLWFLFKYDLCVEFGVGTDGLSDDGAKFDYYFIVCGKDGV
jgi:hypothetical protein